MADTSGLVLDSSVPATWDKIIPAAPSLKEMQRKRSATQQSTRANANLRPPIINPIFLTQVQNNPKQRVELPSRSGGQAQATRFRLIVDDSSPAVQGMVRTTAAAAVVHPGQLSPLSSGPDHEFQPRMNLVPEEVKDLKYFERRKRNNAAAKRSRDQKKMRENKVANKAGVLEGENTNLRTEVGQLRTELATLRMLLMRRQLEENQRAAEQLLFQKAATSIFLDRIGGALPILLPQPIRSPEEMCSIHELEPDDSSSLVDIVEHDIKSECDLSDSGTEQS